MKLRVYLDTSVLSAYFDDRVPERKSATHEFWDRKEEFELSTSALAQRELEQAPDEELKTHFLGLLQATTIHPLTAEMEDVARRYVAAGVFTATMYNDALHVAAAVLTRNDVLLSWNFRHLVNRRRRAQVNSINASLGIPPIDIVAPPEI